MTRPTKQILDGLEAILNQTRDMIYPVCPQCDGRGGSEGYYSGDWTSCFCCNPEEDRHEPIVRIWFWQVWRNHFNLWKLDRWVDRQIRKDEAE